MTLEDSRLEPVSEAKVCLRSYCIANDILGFSGADLHSLCQEAVIATARCPGILTMDVAEVPPVDIRHLIEARQCTATSVDAEGIQHYVRWNNQFGSFKRSPQAADRSLPWWDPRAFLGGSARAS